MESKGGEKRFFSPIYAKLNEDGIPNSKLLDQSDYDSLVNFMKFSFPTTFKIHRDMEESLKRTFVFGKTEAKAKSKYFRKPAKSGAITGVRARKFRVDRTAPRNLKYSSFLELNSLWKGYIADVLKGDTKVSDMQQKLNRVDMHGALIKVSQSNCESFLNLEGIIIKETKNTFMIVTQLNETKTIPKSQSTFEVVIPEKGIMEISGSCFVSRPAERTNKKIKSFIEFLGPRQYRRHLLGQAK